MIIPNKLITDITGDTYGRLKVIEFSGIHADNFAYWQCKCDCGNDVEVNGASLRRGKTKSCGCLYRDMVKINGRKNKTHGKSRDRVYRTWAGMKARCYKEHEVAYKNYGGRGITVCDRWLNSFENFLEDMGLPPSEIYSIDRIDVNGNYEPSNCRWATPKTQARNRRSTKFVLYKGMSMNIDLAFQKAAQDLGMTHGSIRNRYHKSGFTLEETMYTPKGHYNKWNKKPAR